MQPVISIRNLLLNSRIIRVLEQFYLLRELGKLEEAKKTTFNPYLQLVPDDLNARFV